MKNAFAALIAALSFTAASRAAADSLACLNAAAAAGTIAACQNEGLRFEPRPAVAAASPAADAGKRWVSTPWGFTTVENGSLKAGALGGMDSGFSVAFAAVEYVPVAILERGNGMMENRQGTAGEYIDYLAMGLGFLLSIPAFVIGALVGGPIGAVAGMIAEKVSPGSTGGWFRI